MPTPTDESAARTAEKAGGRLRLRTSGRIYTMEPASFTYDGGVSGHFVANPGVYHNRPPFPPKVYQLWGAPHCTECSAVMAWTGPPRRVGRLWIYKMRGHEGSDCRCAPYDFIRSPFRLVVGGMVEWWADLGWLSAASPEPGHSVGYLTNGSGSVMLANR